MSPFPLLACDALAKAYGGRRVLDGIQLAEGPGALALMGPNGVGKSTLISLCAGILAPDAGRIRIAGHDLVGAPLAARASLAYVPDDPVAYPFMRGQEFLLFVCALRGLPESAITRTLVQGFGLAEALSLRFDAMSLGTQRKIQLVAGFMGDPAVLLMDEPSNGLDPAACAFLAQAIRARSATGLSFFSTHDERLVDATGARILRLPLA